MTIILYDIPSNTPECAWSPNTWKIRYALNYRNIPYKTEWIEYPDIEPHCIKHGIKPTGKLKSKRTDPSTGETIETVEKDYYSLPAIYDPSTNTYLANSLPIAEYLEKTYPPTPESPALFPHGTHGLQAAFTTVYNVATRDDGVAEFIVPATYTRLNDASRAYFRRTREERFGGRKLEEIEPRKGSEEERANWAKFRDAMGVLEGWYSKTDVVEDGGTVVKRTPFLMGDTLSWADLVVAGYTIWLRILWGEESERWQDIKTLHEGRWRTLIDSLKKYETVV